MPGDDFQDFFAHAPIGIFTAAPDGRFTSANPALARLYGYDSPEEMIKSVTEIATQVYADPADHQECIRLLHEQGKVVNHACRMRRRDGSVFWAASNVRTVQGQEGRITAYQGFTTDITDQKLAEKRERENEARFGLMFMIAPMPYQSLDGQGYFLEVNQAFLDVLGYTREDLAGKNFADILHPDWVDHFKTNFPRFKAVGEVLGVEFVMVKKDGSTILVHFNGKIQHDDQGRFQRTHCIFQDVTERKRAEEALQQSESMLKDILESTLSGYWDWNLVDNTEYLSPTFKRMFGYEDHEMESSPEAWQRIIFPEDLPGVLAVFDRHVKSRGREPFRNEVRYRHRDGSTVWVICAGRVIEWAEDGTPIRMVGCHMDITERKLAERALRRSENLFRKVFEILPIGLWIADRNGRLLQANPAGVAIWGVEPVIDQNAYGVFRAKRLPSGEEIAPNDWALAHTVNKGETIVDELLEIDAFDGKKKIILNHAAPVLDDAGKVEAAIVVNQDITARYQAEEALRESEEMQRRLLQSVPDLIIRTDLEGTIIFVNELVFPGLDNLPRQHISGMNIFSFVAPHDLSRAIENARQRWERDIGPQVYQLQLNDCLVDVEINGAVIRDREFRPAGMVFVIRDITERKRADEALRESEARFRNLFEHVPTVAVQGYGMDGTTLFWNQAAETFYGYSAEEAIGKNLCDLIIPPELRPDVLQAMKTMSETGVPIPAGELQLKRKDGSSIQVYSSHAIIQKTGSSPELLCIDVDLTELKKAEQALLQAQKMESIGILAGGVAHDFNNLLQAMGGNIELLLQAKPPDDPDTPRLQNVARSISHAAQLVRQLLLFGRKAESRRARVNLNHEVQEAIRILERTIPKMITLELHLDPSAWPLLADSVQIEQILLNLVGNAVDAMPEGGKLMLETRNEVLDEAFIRLHAGATTGPHVLLIVTDTGCGMDREALKHVFDPFFTTKGVGKGTGLGLASVYGIVQNHGGHIQCYSEPGAGTTFKMYWPAVRGEEGMAEESSQEFSLEGGSETIMVVDDDSQIIELTREALEMLGYSVRMALSGEQALEIYQQQDSPIDLVLLDLNMPGMGGYKCLQELLRYDPALKIVIASGYTANGQGKAPLASGAKGFLGKPYQLRELGSMVRRVLDGKEAGM